METLIATGIFALCMAGLALGFIAKGKPVKKTCGVDPATGEALGYCLCEAEGREPCCDQEEDSCLYGPLSEEKGAGDGKEPRVVRLHDREKG